MILLNKFIQVVNIDRTPALWLALDSVSGNHKEKIDTTFTLTLLLVNEDYRQVKGEYYPAQLQYDLTSGRSAQPGRIYALKVSSSQPSRKGRRFRLRPRGEKVRGLLEKLQVLLWNQSTG